MRINLDSLLICSINCVQEEPTDEEIQAELKPNGNRAHIIFNMTHIYYFMLEHKPFI